MTQPNSTALDPTRLTARQREIYDFIKERVTVNGCPPTVREIGEQFGISSPNGVMCHLRALEKKGFIVRDPNAARAIRLAEAVGNSVASSARLPVESLSSLTAKQREIYEFIADTIQVRGYPPTVREIGAEFGIRSPNGVMCHLRALEKKGVITRDSSSARGIRLVNSPLQLLNASNATAETESVRSAQGMNKDSPAPPPTGPDVQEPTPHLDDLVEQVSNLF